VVWGTIRSRTRTSLPAAVASSGFVAAIGRSISTVSPNWAQTSDAQSAMRVTPRAPPHASHRRLFLFSNSRSQVGKGRTARNSYPGARLSPSPRRSTQEQSQVSGLATPVPVTFPGSKPSGITTEHSVTYRGGSAPAFHRLPCF
jgi:hypothetical protein